VFPSTASASATSTLTEEDPLLETAIPDPSDEQVPEESTVIPSGSISDPTGPLSQSDDEIDMQLEDGSGITASRDVTVHFNGDISEATYVRFAINGTNENDYGPLRSFRQDMDVRISGYQGKNYVNAQFYDAAGNELDWMYKEITYSPPTTIAMEIDGGANVSLDRDLDVSFSGDLSEASHVSYAINSTDDNAYGPMMSYAADMQVRIPNYRGDNYVNVWFYNEKGKRIAWRYQKIEYRPPVNLSLTINQNEDITGQKSVSVEVSGETSDIVSARFAVNSTSDTAYSAPQAFSPLLASSISSSR